MREQFERDGFLVVAGFAAAREVAALRARADAIVDAVEPHPSMLSREYYLGSGDAVRCFFAPDAFDERAGLRRSKRRSVVKIGQALDEREPVFRRFARDPRLHGLALELGIAQPLIYQSMYVVKQPGSAGEIAPHRDAPSKDGRPIRVATLWFALERVGRRNGCLLVRRGSHRGEGGDLEALEVEPGTLVVMDGMLVHASGVNASTRPRHAFTLHVVGAGEPWPPDDWIARSAPLCGFLA